MLFFCFLGSLLLFSIGTLLYRQPIRGTIRKSPLDERAATMSGVPTLTSVFSPTGATGRLLVRIVLGVSLRPASGVHTHTLTFSLSLIHTRPPPTYPLPLPHAALF